MEDFEKMGAFYLGRAFDAKTKKAGESLVLYDSKDLVTHAVCVGMTGSGKTGLCIGLLEEAAIDGVPSIVIDPKGDLSNLLLTFPRLSAEDFEPWINEDDARKKNLSNREYAAEQAQLWAKGLADWGQGGDRIQRLLDSAEFAIYTPGSNAGIQVSILKSFAAPDPAVLDDAELLRDRIHTTTTSLLGLLGVDADPIQSREHILISTILNSAWRQGQDLDLAGLIQQIQTPPMTKIGVLDIESFYPSKERFNLVMSLNNLIASPGFGAWMEGESLDIGQILHTSSGKPRVSIFSIAHLSDAERMFFVSLLLNQVLGWVRTQSGTTSLRAILYMDEIFGYFPPVANPPSKLPLLTLLKQARAFGLGVVLATQNPVDLDYKGLANTGTWFIGRLQTERDKQRVLEGLEGAAASQGGRFDKEAMEQTLAGLGSRVFLMNNTHEDAPEVFQTRWTLSYLRGPLTRNQIKVLMGTRKSVPETQAKTASSPAAQVGAAPAAARSAALDVSALSTAASVRPAIAPDVTQVFIPARGSTPAEASLLYRPMVIGAAKVGFVDPKMGVDESQDVAYLSAVTGEAVPVNWDSAEEAAVAISDLEKDPATSAQYADLPPVATKAKSYERWAKDLVTFLYGSQTLELLKSPSTGEMSRRGESERDFRVRLQQSFREERDRKIEVLRQKYAPRMSGLQERLRRSQQAVERESAQANQAKLQTAISFGTTLLGALLGRKSVSMSTLGRATTAARGVSRSVKEQQDIGRAQESVESLQGQLAELEAELQSETQSLEGRIDANAEQLETTSIKPKKTNISVQLVALAWAPFWRDGSGTATPAWK
ncbi:MAG TPA: ATP-binding protein [Blastocatellia bacterium]|nr:ATP-binding protein [Blastocatellia bacterium]